MLWKQKNTRRALAAPSWVFPGNIAENAAFLSEKVDEVGLLFMESASALAYGPEDLPAHLADLPLSWHVHLPGDLDFHDPAAAAATCLKLMDKVDYLAPRRAVLHPPRGLNRSNFATYIAQLQNFMLYWCINGRDSRDILLENLPEHDISDILTAADKLDASICLDLAHYLLAGGTAQGLPPGLMERVRLLHLCAPAPAVRLAMQKGHHHPLTALDNEGRAVGVAICRAALPDTVFMLELFNWTDLTNSLPVLEAWME